MPLVIGYPTYSEVEEAAERETTRPTVSPK